MKTIYDPETDALYVRFADTPILESEQVADGLILDFDADGKIVAFEFLETRKHLAAGASIEAPAN
jgi:uncharacterized protein YuzE